MWLPRPFRLLLVLVLALGACDDRAPLTPSVPAGPLAAISDAATPGAIPGFYFLPPMVAEPTSTGTFAPALSPQVVVCRLSGTVCAETVATFSTTAGTGGETIRVDTASESYGVQWHTDLSNLQTDTYYRIETWLGVLRLGYADVKPVSSGKELRNADDEVIALKDGRTLPIRFRIETIAAELSELPAVEDCLLASSCVIQHVAPNDPSGVQVVATADSFFVGVFTNGFMDSYVANDPATYGDGVTVIIYGRDTEPCLPFAGDQAHSCSHRETYPVLDSGFDEPQRVEQCLDPNVAGDDFRLHRYSIIGPVSERGRVVQLDPVVASYIDCAGYAAPAPVLAVRVIGAMLRPLGRVFAPAVALAADVRYGGMTTSYSEFGYARPLTFTIVEGDGQTAAAGTTLPMEPRVQLLQGRDEPNHSPALVPAPVANVPVTFTVGPTGGSIAGDPVSVTVLTDATGTASAPWSLGTATGDYTLTATVEGGYSVAFSATATATAGAPDLAFGFQSGSAAPPVRLWRILTNGDTVPADTATGVPTVYSSDTVLLETYFINAGTAEVTSGFVADLRFDTNDTVLRSNWPLGTLLLTTQGYFGTQRSNISGPTSGCVARTAVAELDTNNQVAESDENNNVSTLAYQVCAPPIL